MNYTATALRHTGSAHRMCQDRCRMERRGDRLILTAADGHGARPFVRTGLGARFACTAAVRVLGDGLPAEDVPAAIKRRYDTMVARHLEFRPLAPWELQRLDGRPPEAAYGTTLMAVSITEAGTALYQLGDGEVHIFDADGQLMDPLPADEQCQGHLTSSLCSSKSSSLASFRMAVHPIPAAAVLMFTDGCEGGLIRAAAALTAPEILEEGLLGMFAATRHGDDQTCLAAFDAEIVSGETFQAGLHWTLDNLRAKAKHQRQEQSERAELAQLQSYLSLALQKARRMASGESKSYLNSLRPSVERYSMLRKKYHPC